MVNCLSWDHYPELFPPFLFFGEEAQFIALVEITEVARGGFATPGQPPTRPIGLEKVRDS